MHRTRGLSRSLVGLLAGVSLIFILTLPACLPPDAQQTVATPAPPLTDLAEISPSRPQEPTTSPETPSRPSVSPDANAVIPSPGLPPAVGVSPSPSSPTSTSPAPTGTRIDLTAANIQFDKSTITVPAGGQVIINFVNRDTGIPHNFSVYTDSSASQSIFTGEIITGPASTTYTFTAPTMPGTYFFRCDVHPTLMTGQLIVQ